MQQASQGDRSALTQLLERYGPLVRSRISDRIPSHCRQLVSDEDVMQQTYMDAFLAIPRFEDRGEGSFAAWLETLAQRNLLDVVRLLGSQKRGGDCRAPEGDGEERSVQLYGELSGVTPTPSKDAARREALRALDKAVSSLPALHQQVVRMYDIDNRPLAEVCAATGRSAGAVLMLRARAHARLRSILGSVSNYLSTDT